MDKLLRSAIWLKSARTEYVYKTPKMTPATTMTIPLISGKYLNVREFFIQLMLRRAVMADDLPGHANTEELIAA
ncbi:MAG: hypothetical protein OEU46_07305 [Alphaproteobacteria bacterium]|nr:hypothetical protein [Alphaproteobacteria bacterium]